MKLLCSLIFLLLAGVPAMAQSTTLPIKRPPIIDPAKVRDLIDKTETTTPGGLYQSGDPVESFLHKTISCPTNVRIEMTSRVPSGWEPGYRSVSYLSRAEAKVETLHGYGTRLMCAYNREYGHYLHLAPPTDMPQCSAGKRLAGVPNDVDFVCRPNGDYINAQGTVTVKPSYRVSVSADGQNDFWWVADSPTQQSLSGEGGLSLFVQISTTPDRAFCTRSTASGAGYVAIPGSLLVPGARFCYRTRKGQLGWLEVLARPGNAPTSLQFRYTTWSRLQD